MCKEYSSYLPLQQGVAYVVRNAAYVCVAMALSMLAGCIPAEQPKVQAANKIQVIKKSWQDELVVIVTADKKSPEAEFEKRLIRLFAKQLKAKVKLLPLSPDKVKSALIAGKAHIAAAGLRSNGNGYLFFADPYQEVNEQVVCADTAPRSLEVLTEKTIAVVAGSAQEDALFEVRQKLPELSWNARYGQTVTELLSEVANGKLDCTVANEEQLAMASNFFPKLGSTMDMQMPSRLAWGFAPTSDGRLWAEAQKFFVQIRDDGTLSRLIDHHYGHNDRLHPFDAIAFVKKTRTDLPRLRGLFEEAGLLSGIDWQLLAAISYQESHWDPLATSPTNVRGMMMLTNKTAEYMKVTDRLDMRQSIEAGARYLRLLKNRLPLRIAEEERIWMAIAAYNQGMGHLEDARTLTMRAGLNPDVWGDVKKMMPLLKRPEYFVQTKYGRARGGEAVVMVEKVRIFYDMLKQMSIIEAQQETQANPQLKLSASKSLTSS